MTLSLSATAVVVDTQDFKSVVYKLHTITPPVKKIKITRSLYLHTKIQFGVSDDNSDDSGADLYLQTFYRPPKLVHDQTNDYKITDKVKFRLWLARQIALKKYQEVWKNS
jgi:hypothetical protein